MWLVCKHCCHAVATLLPPPALVRKFLKTNSENLKKVLNSNFDNIDVLVIEALGGQCGHANPLRRGEPAE